MTAIPIVAGLQMGYEVLQKVRTVSTTVPMSLLLRYMPVMVKKSPRGRSL